MLVRDPHVSAYLTFVQSQRLSKEQNLPLIVPDLLPHTPLQWRRHFLAGLRRQRRLTAAKAGTDEDGVSVEVKEEIRSDFVEDQTTRWYVQDDLHTDKFKMHQVELEVCHLLVPNQMNFEMTNK